MPSNNKNIILCGVGGQGTILASKLIAASAMLQGLQVKTAETIGMAQRGGSVFSHLRIGSELHSPLIAPGKADLIIAFEPAEALRHLSFLRPGGSVVTSSRPVYPVSTLVGATTYPETEILEYLKNNIANLTLIDSEVAARDLNSSKVLNVVLLGAAARSGQLGVSEEKLMEAIRLRLPEKFHELNKKALYYTAR